MGPRGPPAFLGILFGSFPVLDLFSKKMFSPSLSEAGSPVGLLFLMVLWIPVLLATKTCPNPARGDGCCCNMGCILQTWIEIGAIYFKYGSWGPSCGQAWPWVCTLGCLWKFFCDHPLGPDAQEQFEMPLLAFCCVLIDSGDVGQGVNGRR